MRGQTGLDRGGGLRRVDVIVAARGREHDHEYEEPSHGENRITWLSVGYNAGA